LNAVFRLQRQLSARLTARNVKALQ